VKRVIITLLFICFSVYSIVVYTIGTELPQKFYFSEQALNGKLLFQKYNCISCHQLFGLGGYLGPELTTIVKNENGRELIARAILKTGTDRMPDFHLSQTEIDCLVEYLKYVGATSNIKNSN
jgi:nitric oxide reductase subunit C